MLDYYYIDLYFDPKRYKLGQVVESCVNSLTEGGCQFQKVTMANPDTSRSVDIGEHVALALKDLPAIADADVQEMLESGQKFIPFPPLGRVMFTYPFNFDDVMMDDIHEEEDDTHSTCEDLGLTFMYSAGGADKKIKASLIFWEEYVLTHGSPEVQAENMRKILGFIKRIAMKTPPYFGAINNELHLDTDGALDRLRQGQLPEGNEFTIVGAPLVDKLRIEGLRDKGYMWSQLPDGGLIIQMADKWEGISAV